MQPSSEGEGAHGSGKISDRVCIGSMVPVHKEGYSVGRGCTAGWLRTVILLLLLLLLLLTRSKFSNNPAKILDENQHEITNPLKIANSFNILQTSVKI